MSQRSRYDAARPASSSISGKVLVVFALVLIVGFAVAFAQYLRTADNQSVNISFASSEPINDSTLRVWADVTRKDVTLPAYCIVTALNYDRAEVGRHEVYIAPGGESVQRIEVDVPTREAAVAGGAYGCSHDIPFYLDTTP